MREILFRGMTVNGKFVEGNLSILKNDLYYSAKIDKGYYIANSCGAPFAYQVRPDTVGQFTGLVDRNGKRIFEGDVIHDEDSGAIGEVFFNNDGTGGYSTWFLGVGYNCALSVLDSTNLVIIGTIHDNPELVEA
jgi:uncharacterized phage protein (TIGR01671 family)